MRRLFVANRGEIARRIAASALRGGIAPVVPPLDGPDAVDLLDTAAVVRAAVAAGADAVHPGYGFLAESPDLARAVLDAGLAWVGPSPEAIAALGDKAGARATARRAEVPVADGEAPADQSDTALASCAARIGYPVLAKPVAGGGGKGIRVVRVAPELAPALAAGRREATRAFGDARLLIERYVDNARHVEVQVLGDRHGSLVHLGDRDCSLQRRHQKLLEEAPAPGLPRELRTALWAAALRLAGAVLYTSAGTCEFLVGGDGAFVFLEMNARLQVEHPVTELVLGRDLVADQLAIADGARLGDIGLDQHDVEERLAHGGHAVEVRLNAEDPGRGFLPSAGRVVAVRWPEGATAFGPAGEAGLRVDAGIAEGDEVGGRFDPLLAKVITIGPDRATALARLGDALDRTEVLGLATNLAFLRRLVRLPAVREGRARIDTVESDPDVVAAARSGLDEVPLDAAWLAAARALTPDAGPAWPWGGGWRASTAGRLRLAAPCGEGMLERSVAVASPDPSAPAPLAVLSDGLAHVSIAGASVAFGLAPPPDLETAARAAAGVASTPGVAGPVDARSPLPGTVLAVHVRPGDLVEAGAPLATIEAMKMEHVVTAPGPARVEAVLVGAGDPVDRGRPLARLRGSPDTAGGS